MKLKSGLIYEALIVLISISLGVLTNRFLGTEQRGILAAVMLYPSILSSASSLQWDRQIISDIKSKKVSSSTVKQIIAGTALTNGIFAAIIVVVLSIIDQKISADEIILIGIYSIVSIPCSLIQLYTNSYLIAINQTLQIYYNRIILPVAMLLIFVILINFKNIGYLDVILITMISWMFTTIYIWNNCKLKLTNIKEILNNEKNQLIQYKRNVAHLLDCISSNVDVIVVLKFMPLNFAGAYIFFKLIDLPYKIILFGFINASPGQLLKEKKINIEYLRRFLLLITAPTFLALLVPIQYYEVVVDIVVGASFVEFSYLIKPLTVCYWTSTIGAHGSTLLIHTGAVAKLYVVQRFDLLFRSILTVILTIGFGWLGLVLSIVITNLVKIILVSNQLIKYK